MKSRVHHIMGWNCSCDTVNATFRRKTVLTHFNWNLSTFRREAVSTWNYATCVIIIHKYRQFETSFENTQWTNSNKCNQCRCDIASIQASDLRVNLKTHNGEKTTDFPRFFLKKNRIGLSLQIRRTRILRIFKIPSSDVRVTLRSTLQSQWSS